MSNNQLKEVNFYYQDYKIPVKCGRDYFHTFFTNKEKEADDETDVTQISCLCGVPRWCHRVKKSLLNKPEEQQEQFVQDNYCGLTKKQLKKDYPDNYITNNGLCVPCLYNGICCSFFHHPEGESPPISSVDFNYHSNYYLNNRLNTEIQPPQLYLGNQPLHYQGNQENLIDSKSKLFFFLKGFIINAKSHKSLRFRMYENCEKNFAFIRKDNSEDGIYYSSSDLNCKDLFFQVLFENLKDRVSFKNGIDSIFKYYFLRKRVFEAIDQAPSLKFEITLESVIKINNFSKIMNISTSSYSFLSDDPSPSIPCDSDSLSYTSNYTAVTVQNPEVQRCLLSTTKFNLEDKKTERCHILSQSKYPTLKDDPNNIVYMYGELHDYFDGINMININVPIFTIEYVSHHDTPIPSRIVGDSTLFYAVTVRVLFRDEKSTSILFLFKDGLIESETIGEFPSYLCTLEYSNPLDFQKYCNKRNEFIFPVWRGLKEDSKNSI